jgi:hypothetical protein
MKGRQPPLYLITGVVLGLLAGLLISYVILPVRYSNTSPNTLSAAQRSVYRGLVARAYLYEADPARAFSRLALLGEENLGEQLVSQAQQMVASNADSASARGLALLASVLTNPEVVITPLAVQVSTPTPDLTKNPGATNTSIPPTSTPFATYTPRPTATLKPTQGAPYQIVGEPKNICDPARGTPLLMVFVYDKSGAGISGVQLQVSVTNGGQNDFFTGFYPEISEGYADTEMMAGFTYSLRVGEGGEVLSGLAPPECTRADGSTYPGSLEVKFKQP